MEQELNEEFYKKERKAEWRDKIRKEIKSKDRTGIPKIRMPEENPSIRNKSNIEVNKGLTLELALSESQRCLDCVSPTCVVGCPVGTNIPKFIKYLEAGEILEAARMDGATLREEVLYVLTPMAIPGMASTILLNIILAWNEAFWTLNLTAAKAAPLTAFITSYSSPEGLFYAKLSMEHEGLMETLEHTHRTHFFTTNAPIYFASGGICAA